VSAVGIKENTENLLSTVGGLSFAIMIGAREHAAEPVSNSVLKSGRGAVHRRIVRMTTQLPRISKRGSLSEDERHRGFSDQQL
jgi:hypothetical protein